MRIRNVGQITDNLWLLGTEESCVYLLTGSQSSAIISAGMNYLVPEMLRQIKMFGIDAGKIAHLIILHAHFDHLGIVPFFKRNYPAINIYASERGWSTIANPKAIAVINKYSMLVTERIAGAADKIAALDWMWRDDVTGITVKEGDRIDLGGFQIDIYETPGHSSCSISAYVPQLSALFPSDAAAIPYLQEMIPAPNSNFTLYRQSLKKLSKLKIKIIGADHFGYIVADEAANYLADSISATDAMSSRFEQALAEEKDINKAADRLVSEFYQSRKKYFIAPEIMNGVYCQMLKFLAQQKQT